MLVALNRLVEAKVRRLLGIRSIPHLVDAGSIPAGYGVALNERAVEYPWAIPRLRGRVLDVGSALNHGWVLDRVLPRVDELHIVTLAPERRSFVRRGISYVYADARELPYRNGVFDTVCCLSTLEHIGMDNSGYGGGGAAADPDVEQARAVAEMHRVLAPDGRLLVTVPYGRLENHGWLRQFDEQALRRLFDLDSAVITVYAYRGRDGWTPATLATAADASYRAGPEPADLANAARAVALIELSPGSSDEKGS
jgi:SAM-dependent methyltransferase